MITMQHAESARCIDEVKRVWLVVRQRESERRREGKRRMAYELACTPQQFSVFIKMRCKVCEIASRHAHAHINKPCNATCIHALRVKRRQQRGEESRCCKIILIEINYFFGRLLKVNMHSLYLLRVCCRALFVACWHRPRFGPLAPLLYHGKLRFLCFACIYTVRQALADD